MIRNLGYQRNISGRHEDDQESFSGRPQPFSGRRGDVDTQIFLACSFSSLCGNPACCLTGFSKPIRVSSE